MRLRNHRHSSFIIHSLTHILYTVLVKPTQGYQAAHRFSSGLTVEARTVEVREALAVEVLEAVAVSTSQLMWHLSIIHSNSLFPLEPLFVDLTVPSSVVPPSQAVASPTHQTSGRYDERRSLGSR